MAPNELAVRHGVGHAKCMVPTLSQPLAAFALSAACAYHVQRCLPPFVLHVDIGLSVDGQLHHLQVAILRGNVDDGVAVARVLQQKLDRDTVTFNDKRIEGTFRISCAAHAQCLTKALLPVHGNQDLASGGQFHSPSYRRCLDAVSTAAPPHLACPCNGQ